MPVKRGDFLTGGGYPAIAAKRADDRLRAEFPLLQNVIEAAGPVPSPEKLREFVEQRQRLAERLAEIKAKIAELRAAGKSS